MVKIILASIIAKATNGEREITVTAPTLRDALSQLVHKYGDPVQQKIFAAPGKPRRFLNIYVNGKNIQFLQNLDTPLLDTDEVTILPSVTGG